MRRRQEHESERRRAVNSQEDGRGVRKSKGAAAAPCAASQSVRVEAVACSALMPCSS